MHTTQRDIDERTNLTGLNQFELLLFRLGQDKQRGVSELFGINVFKVREIVAMPAITPIVGAPTHALGVAQLREQVIPVYDLPAIVGCTPGQRPALMIVTEFARSTQAFAVESVEDIVRLDWNQVVSAEASDMDQSLVTSLAKLPDGTHEEQLVQVLDVEEILQRISPVRHEHQNQLKAVQSNFGIKAGTIVLAADDSAMARALLEQSLQKMDLPFEIVKTGKEAWERLNSLAQAATLEGKTIYDKVSLVITDLEMPEMDGFTLTRKIKQSADFNKLPVVIHSSLSGMTNEEHVKRVGADGYVVKFAAEELSKALQDVLTHTATH